MADHIGMHAPRTAFVDADSNGGNDIEIVAAVTGKRIVVDHLTITASAAASAFLESGASTVIFPTVYLAAGDNYTIDDPGVRTTSGAALTFSATVTGNISVFVKYHLVDTFA